jgi:ParB-like chromosome segregation protein Spo0J
VPFDTEELAEQIRALGVPLRKTADLLPYSRNPRKHDEGHVAALCGSIREYGWTSPLLIDERNEILAGHGRLLAARKLGLETVPVVLIERLTETQRKAYRITDNILPKRTGETDFDLLALELKDIIDDGFNAELTGFDDKELQAILKEDPTEGGLPLDDFSDGPDQPAQDLHTCPKCGHRF